MKEIPGELILNWDQTGIKMVSSNGYIMEQEGEKQVEITGRMTSSKSLPIQAIYKCKIMQDATFISNFLLIGILCIPLSTGPQNKLCYSM